MKVTTSVGVEAVERGLDRLARSGGDPARLAPVSVIMIPRIAAIRDVVRPDPGRH